MPGIQKSVSIGVLHPYPGADRGGVSRGRTDEVMQADIHGHAQLGANAIGPADQNGIPVPCGLEVEDAAKAADLGVCACSACRADIGFDGLDEGVPSVHRDSGLGVSEPTRRRGCRRQSPIKQGVFSG